jgi:IclR family acetate operon transcriptional repressor
MVTMRAAAESATDPARTYDVAVVVKAVDLLEALAAGKALGLTELTARSGLSKGAAFRILTTLERRGYVDKHTDTKRYSAGPGLIALCNAFLSGQELLTTARPVLQGLREQSGETVNVGVLDGAQVLYLDVLESSHDLRTAGQVGRRDPVHCTALGKALLACLPPEEARLLLHSYPREALGPKTVTSVDAIITELESVRKHGYAVDDEETGPGVCCVGAPVPTTGAGQQLAVSVSGPAARVKSEGLERMGLLVRNAALDLGRRLGAV